MAGIFFEIFMCCFVCFYVEVVIGRVRVVVVYCEGFLVYEYVELGIMKLLYVSGMAANFC